LWTTHPTFAFATRDKVLRATCTLPSGGLRCRSESETRPVSAHAGPRRPSKRPGWCKHHRAESCPRGSDRHQNNRVSLPWYPSGGSPASLNWRTGIGAARFGPEPAPARSHGPRRRAPPGSAARRGTIKKGGNIRFVGGPGTTGGRNRQREKAPPRLRWALPPPFLDKAPRDGIRSPRHAAS
jgi:hypothetical protein